MDLEKKYQKKFGWGLGLLEVLDQERRWIFFLMCSLEEGVLLSDFFLFFMIKIRLDLIFNIKI